MQFTLNDRDLSHVDEKGTRLVGSGKYSIAVGGGQPGRKAPFAAAEFEIQGNRNLPR